MFEQEPLTGRAAAARLNAWIQDCAEPPRVEVVCRIFSGKINGVYLGCDIGGAIRVGRDDVFSC